MVDKKNLNERVKKSLSYISELDLQEITNKCKGDGCGLLSGGLIDMLITSFFKKIDEYKVRQT